jgi:hypothetical protein
LDEGAAEKVFRHKVLALLRRRGRLSQERIEMLSVSLSRLHFTPGAHEVVYVPKGGHDDIEATEGERIDAMEFVARVLVQIPDPRRHLVRYYRRGRTAQPSGADGRS